ncbi:amidohydrolase family protein [uncultured Sphingomonas sp.]|uniref:amidohydrolase family protein n=1 Tax=uncultured Sphingomonas sp. TaxID=158754 RepID=UPI0035CCA792
MAIRARVAMAAVALATTPATAAPFANTILPPPSTPGAAVMPYVRVPAGRIALAHVRVIDGTGAPPRDDMTVVLDGARIVAVQPAATPIPAGTIVLDLTGRTVMPGLVGMHDHMYYIGRPDLDAQGHSEPPLVVPQMTFTSPRLYLAAGVTTLRTTGSVEPYTDLNLKRQIDAGAIPGPHMDVTGPYLEGAGSPFIRMHQLHDAEDARRTVAFWAEQGATSFKAYMNITRAELAAAVGEAHRRGLKITGHLCAVSYPEAAALGIDNLEHGFFVNTQNDPGKQPDRCSAGAGTPTLAGMAPGGANATALITLLVRRHVALTSTLPVFEQSIPTRVPLQPRAMEAMTPEAREAYLYARNARAMRPNALFETAYANDMGLERQFVAAGGLLLAGPDPTGNGGVVPGFGDQREVELLVEAGFTPVEAIRIATLNGATYLGLASRIGTVVPGKDADLIVVKGDPAARIADIEQVEITFKDGVGYDSAKLIQSVRGRYGQY